MVHPNAAGLDIGAETIVAAVSPNLEPEHVRAFATFTPDLHALVDWLRECSIDTVAMESTGVYWIPIYELLEQAGITPYLVNAQHVKTVPGRKPIGMMLNGCRSCTCSACCKPRFDRTSKSALCVRLPVIGPSCFDTVHRISYICSRRSSK